MLVYALGQNAWNLVRYIQRSWYTLKSHNEGQTHARDPPKYIS